ncbi:NAD(P)H-binding protein [Nocardia sp. SYP-A9097]|uniref:NmrA family NAD(P)-binding protein n=1 Tax=Nocardia sp. SYP-A9097 TaxID=2663237 RepID=UPI00129A6333|nr:NmrA family NAD(P)-binding protein [Nocardia sp. SYP-A9097]MRH90975.1 NAD(P)H-binding protein [Nocardia sp. SYP-A9097]
MSARNDLVLVTAATGKQGGATARRLLAAGRPVRALVRDPESAAAQQLAAAGAELAVGDFDAPDTVAVALRGVSAVLIVPPAAFGPDGWDVDLEARRGENLVAAARDAGVDQLVFTGIASFELESQWGAYGKRRIEEAVRASGLRWTILRPVRFMENYLAQGFPVDGIKDGVHHHLFPADLPVQMIAVDDVAAFAELAFTDPDHFHGRILELAGDERTMVAAAAVISEITGHTVTYEELSEDFAAGMGDEVLKVFQMSRAGQGWHADLPALREILPALRTFETWLTETGAAQLKPLLAG